MNRLAYELGKKKAEHEMGPWDMTMFEHLKARGALGEKMENLMSKLKEKHPGHYYANPMVPGPITRFINEYSTKPENNDFLYELLKHKDSPSIS